MQKTSTAAVDAAIHVAVPVAQPTVGSQPREQTGPQCWDSQCVLWEYCS